VTRVRDLPTVDEMAAERARKNEGFPKGKSRLEVRKDQKPLTVVDERTFKAIVWKRDDSHCRKCRRKVVKGLIKRVPERGEVNHIHGRLGDLRFEDRAALLLCLSCHELVTGKVNERWVILATKTFKIGEREYTDARFPVVFRRVA
jgi:hypothetical protein